MKKSILFFISTFFFISVFSQKSEPIFDIKGITEEKDNGKAVRLLKADKIVGYGYQTIDSTVVNDNSFHFTGKENIDGFAYITVGDQQNSQDKISLFLEKGQINVLVDSNFRGSSHISGTVLNDSLQKFFNDQTMYVIEINRRLNDNDGGNHTSEGLSIKKGSELARIMSNYELFLYNYQKEHINDPIGKYMFLDNYGGNYLLLNLVKDSMFYEIYNAADEDIRNNPIIAKRKEKLDTSIKNRKIRETLVGKKYIDCELKMLNGVKKKLSDYIGKSDYLYIDFCASWCGPCIREMPKLKEIYERLGENKLTILGISMDHESKDWENSIKRINVPWDQLSELAGISQSAIAKSYLVEVLPAGVLIDRNGAIVEIGLSGTSLESIIEQLDKAVK
ncbi:MAG: AhpC/TSA family protein [Prevotella sp.]|jgi:peroxiredoxin|nr:AhpC/TSA family protein [Prevotella sp.]